MRADPKDVYKKSVNRQGRLNADDPVGRAVIVHDDFLGGGGEGFAYRGQLTAKYLTDEGYRALALPILTHQELRKNSRTIESWESARDRAEMMLGDMNKQSVECLVRDFYERWGLMKGQNQIAVRIARHESLIDKRHSRMRYITGLHHPNLAHIFEFGQLKPRNNGTEQYYAYDLVELLDGHLEPDVTSGWPLDVQIKIMKQVVRGLKQFHQLGFIHRDVKPSNIFHKAIQQQEKNPYSQEPQVKLADYGYIRPENIDLSYNTRDGAFFGSPYFMSPEQAKNSKKAEWESDQFSAGATFYALLTGKEPVKLKSGIDAHPLSLARAVSEQDFKLDSMLERPDIRKEGIQMIISKMMQKDPRDRYPDYDQILEDLDRVHFEKLPVHASYSNVPIKISAKNYDNHFTNARKRRNRWIAAGMAGTIAAAGAAAYSQGYLDELIKGVSEFVQKF